MSVSNMLMGDIHNNRDNFSTKLFAYVLNIFGLSYFPVEKFETYMTKYGLLNRVCLKKERKGLYAPSSEIDDEEGTIPKEVEMKDLYLSECSDVIITGNSDMVVDLKNHCVINDFCYDMDESVFFVDGLAYRFKQNNCLLRSNFSAPIEEIETGIMLSGKFSHNYYHSVYENISRLLLLNNKTVSEDVPLLVDKYTVSTPSLCQMIDFMMESKRNIIVLKESQLYRCHHLYYIDHPHCLIPHVWKTKNSYNQESVFDSIFIKRQHDILVNYKSSKMFGKRIFLTRSNTTSRHYNEQDIFEVLKKYDFVKIDPATLTLPEQVSVFFNAEWIIGGSGAAFTNLLFCNKGCKVLCFYSIPEKKGSPLFNAIAMINGATFWHYNPDKFDNSGYVHSDYYIDPVRLENVLLNHLA